MKLLKIIVFSAGIVFSICLYSQNLQKYLLQSPVNYININGEEFVKRDLNAMLNYLFINVNFSEHSAEAEYEWINFYSRPHPSVKTLRKYFAQAAYEFKVPQQLLEIIAYTESNWTQIGPSIDRGWGIMHLVQNDYTNTLGEAASLINVKPEILKNNAQLNIRGAAALISKYAGNNKKYFTKYEDWFDALLSFTGLINEELKQKQVITYYHNLCNGVVSNTLWDETIEIAAIPNIDISSKIKSYSSQPKNITTVDYAPAIAGFISCNYATGRSHIIDTWVNHWIGVGTYAGAISWFNNCNAQASAHFVIRASDGEITQCVNISNTAWHCGASGYPNNSRSIGVEHEATSSNPNLWNSTYMLSASANMACYFASKYSIPSSFHTSPGICGHNEMPGTNTACPGTLPWTSWINLYNSCMASSQGPINLTANVSNCPSKNVTFSWTNSGNGWYIALSTDINFGQYYWKWVSGLTSYTGPAGFVDHIDNSPLVFQNGLTYYWKIWNGSNYTSVKQFSIPMCDTLSPTISINSLNAWQTKDFMILFNDVDNQGGSGIYDKFLLVSDDDGLNKSSNVTQGFFYEEFSNSLSNLWINVNGAGSWCINNGCLEQNDENISNSIITANLTQSNSSFLYSWKGYISSIGASKRIGFHFFASNAAQTNRGDSYLVIFDAATNNVYICKSLNNDLKIKQISSYVINTDIWYNFKILYNSFSGLINVYVNNKLVASWVDLSPLISGNFISLRNEGCKVKFDDIKVYRSRGQQESIKIGNSQDDYIRYENLSPFQYAATIYSINIDNNNNFSDEAFVNIKVDTTLPSTVIVNDGLIGDLDTLNVNDTIIACWNSATDISSGISKYLVCLGTSLGDSNVVGWLDNGVNLLKKFNVVSLCAGQKYFVSVKTFNNAGLYSISYSDGVYILDNSLGSNNIYNNNEIIRIYPNPATEYVEIYCRDKIIHLIITDIIGKIVYNNFLLSTSMVKINLLNFNFQSGIYILHCITAKGVYKKKFLVE